ncbi:transposase zinc-binding domain-containing protein [Sporolactobacillus shoreicorticis]|uniref:Transposase zinc-binding domain-containing protein n=1 Tax=Sporolactobacillus shoreicorticis TaxID=1923877 RepID=A0ABW5S4H4_9BACL|nr:transposase zinc-binding domain-containing protein [Sporolactobacillus shoreicorticis]MCO7127380.1 transposase zinc-binding domain-containing protein [Sporolactobacillus shoreicorticis]
MVKRSSGIIKRILKDHFDGFWKFHSDLFPESYREDIKETVQKTIKCGTRDLGFAKYECLGCEENPAPVFIGFTCKSRFCHKCGKKYTDDWADKQQEMIFNVPHRHMVFTVPKELRQVFYNDRRKLNELSQKVAEVFKFYYHQKSKKRQLQVGIITVIHTSERDLKFNPHIHTLVTEGALDNRHEWRSSDYISYDFLRKFWQKLRLDATREWFPGHEKVAALVNDLYQWYPKGFYVNAERKMKDVKGAAKYIGRYLARPAIAEYRIESYDGEKVHLV